jgi:hypothetical protein
MKYVTIQTEKQTEKMPENGYRYQLMKKEANLKKRRKNSDKLGIKAILHRR